MRISGAHSGRGGIGRNPNKTSGARLQRLQRDEATWRIVLMCQSLAKGLWFCGNFKRHRAEMPGQGCSKWELKWMNMVIRNVWIFFFFFFQNMRSSQLALSDAAESAWVRNDDCFSKSLQLALIWKGPRYVKLTFFGVFQLIWIIQCVFLRYWKVWNSRLDLARLSM